MALVVLEASDVLEVQVAQVAIALVAVASVAPEDSKYQNIARPIGRAGMGVTLREVSYSAEAVSFDSSGSGSLKSVMPASTRMLYQVISFLMWLF